MLFHFETRSWARVALPNYVMSCVCQPDRFAVALGNKDVVFFKYDGVSVKTLIEVNAKSIDPEQLVTSSSIGLMLCPMLSSVFLSFVRRTNQRSPLTLGERWDVDLDEDLTVAVFELRRGEAVAFRRFTARDILPSDVSTDTTSAMRGAVLVTSFPSTVDVGTHCILTCTAISSTRHATYVTAVTFDTKRKRLTTRTYTYLKRALHINCELNPFYSSSWFWFDKLLVHDNEAKCLEALSRDDSDDPGPIELSRNGKSWPETMVSERHLGISTDPRSGMACYVGADQDYVIFSLDHGSVFIWTFSEESEFGNAIPLRKVSFLPEQGSAVAFA